MRVLLVTFVLLSAWAPFLRAESTVDARVVMAPEVMTDLADPGRAAPLALDDGHRFSELGALAEVSFGGRFDTPVRLTLRGPLEIQSDVALGALTADQFQLGGGLGLSGPGWLAFADVHRDVVGIDGVVAETGIDLVADALAGLTVSAGPRLIFADGFDLETQGDFGGPDALSAGLAFSARVEAFENWGVGGTIRWDRPIGEGELAAGGLGADRLSAEIVATRRFSFEF